MAVNKMVKAGDLFLNVKDYGAKGDYNTNDTAAINAAISAAATAGRCVFFPSGTYTCDNIIIPPFVRIQGEGGSPSRFMFTGLYLENTRRSGTALRRVTGSTNPLLTQAGEGSWVENFELQGNAGTAPIYVHNGFQTTAKSITAIGGAGIGMDIQRANNSRFYDLEVQNCGSATLPGVKIWSKDKTTLPYGIANETNTLDIYGLTIERCTNVHLDIAWDPADTNTNPEYWAEFIRIYNLHVESSAQNSGVGANVGNTDPAIRIGGVRSVHFIAPFIYGGPGPLIEHKEQLVRTYLRGGVKFTNGTFIGSDTTTGVAASTNLIKLTEGTDVSFESIRWARCTGSAILVASTYEEFKLSDTNYPDFTITDNRTVKSEYKTEGNLTVNGHVSTGGVVPTLSNGSGATGATILGGSTDNSGKCFFGTTATPPAAGAIVLQINFAKTWGIEKPVVVSAGNAATAALGLFAAVSADGTNLKVYAQNAPAASQGNTVYQFNYRVA